MNHRKLTALIRLFPPEKLAEVFGNSGIAASDHIVVYHAENVWAGWLISVLEYMGATNVSMLNGGLEVWHEAGYDLTDQKPSISPKKFELNVQPEFAASNEFVAQNLDNPRVAIVDIRSIDQSKGVGKQSPCSTSRKNSRFYQCACRHLLCAG